MFFEQHIFSGTTERMMQSEYNSVQLQCYDLGLIMYTQRPINVQCLLTYSRLDTLIELQHKAQ